MEFCHADFFWKAGDIQSIYGVHFWTSLLEEFSESGKFSKCYLACTPNNLGVGGSDYETTCPMHSNNKRKITEVWFTMIWGCFCCVI